jgi:DNA-directed RNA polymerase alpha subunit
MKVPLGRDIDDLEIAIENAQKKMNQVMYMVRGLKIKDCLAIKEHNRSLVDENFSLKIENKSLRSECDRLGAKVSTLEYDGESLRWPDGITVDSSIDILWLSTRPMNCLRNAGIDRIGKLLPMSRESLLEIKGMGNRSVDEIYTTVMSTLNFKMGGREK